MPLSIVIITGQSGSGKSTAIRALEDYGYFCVDNIPSAMVESLVALIGNEGAHNKLALGIDIRERQFLALVPPLVERLRKTDIPVRVIYLEASDEALIRRYSETRRIHPMDNKLGLEDAIMNERQLLMSIRELADDILDTSQLSPHALRALISEHVADAWPSDKLRVAVLSFGFKYGLPLESDMVVDVRFLRNPYFDPELQPFTGLDESVSRYVLDTPEAKEFVERASGLLQFLLPQFKKEGKRRLTVAVGCTGGQHRSVAIARALASHISTLGVGVDLRHRDVKDKKR